MSRHTKRRTLVVDESMANGRMTKDRMDKISNQIEMDKTAALRIPDSLHCTWDFQSLLDCYAISGRKERMDNMLKGTKIRMHKRTKWTKNFRTFKIEVFRSLHLAKNC